jgi:hypothetical protein
MTEETPSGDETIIAEVLELPEKCTKLHVLTAVLKPKCLSNRIQKDRFTAEIVSLNTGLQEITEDIKWLGVTNLHQHLFLFHFFR